MSSKGTGTDLSVMFGFWLVNFLKASSKTCGVSLSSHHTCSVAGFVAVLPWAAGAEVAVAAACGAAVGGGAVVGCGAAVGAAAAGAVVGAGFGGAADWQALRRRAAEPRPTVPMDPRNSRRDSRNGLIVKLHVE